MDILKYYWLHCKLMQLFWRTQNVSVLYRAYLKVLKAPLDRSLKIRIIIMVLLQ